jgi:hypothetical protein
MRERLEPIDPTPLDRGCCDWCGSRVQRGKIYCGADCRVAYNNLTTRQGKAVVQMLKVWRKHRGAKGTPGEGQMTKIAARVDLMLEEDRKRKSEFAKARAAANAA